MAGRNKSLLDALLKKKTSLPETKVVETTSKVPTPPTMKQKIGGLSVLTAIATVPKAFIAPEATVPVAGQQQVDASASMSTSELDRFLANDPTRDFSKDLKEWKRAPEKVPEPQGAPAVTPEKGRKPKILKKTVVKKGKRAVAAEGGESLPKEIVDLEEWDETSQTPAAEDLPATQVNPDLEMIVAVNTVGGDADVTKDLPEDTVPAKTPENDAVIP